MIHGIHLLLCFQSSHIQILDRRLAFLTNRKKATITVADTVPDEMPPFSALIGNLIESSAKPTRVAADSEVEVMWSCTVCTLINDEKATVCIVCDTKRVVEVKVKVKNPDLKIQISNPSQSAVRDVIVVDDASDLDDEDGDGEDGHVTRVLSSRTANLSDSSPLKSDSPCKPEELVKIYDLLGLPCYEVDYSPTSVAIAGRRFGLGKPGKSRFVGINDSSLLQC